MIAGIGFNSGGRHVGRANGKQTSDYFTWKHMIERCYDPKYSALYPTYVGCTTSEDFHDFQKFMDWATVQTGYGLQLSALDKDLLIKGNKQYNADTCIFVPREINGLITKCDARRGLYPLGVSLNQGRFMATLCIEGKNKNLGRYSTPERAFEVYKAAKEAHIKKLAEKFKNVLDVRAYEALLSYVVEITD